MVFAVWLHVDRISAANLELWYPQPATTWEEALPLGNGRIGAMVYGGVERETIQLNEDTFWAGGPHNNLNPAARAALPEIRQLLVSGDYAEASALAEKSITSQGAQGMPYQPAGSVDVYFPGHKNAQQYRRQLTLDDAVARTRYQIHDVIFEREIFTSFVDQAVVMQITASRANALNFSVGLSHPADMPVVEKEGGLLMQGTSPDHEGIAGQVTLADLVQVVSTDGEKYLKNKRIEVRGATEAVLLITLATNFVDYRDVSGNALARAESTMRNAVAAMGADNPSLEVKKSAYKERLLAHQRFYQRFFQRVHLDLAGADFSSEPTDQRIRRFAGRDDPSLAALYFQFGRYLLISSSQPGTQPANLQGIWNPHQNPPWDSKYTLNINAQMNYWPSEVTQLDELNEPFIRLIRELSQTGRDTAKIMYGAAGWAAHHNTDIWRISGAVDGPWGPWPTSSAWLVEHLWQKYLYTGDQNFLREHYDIMTAACAFFEEFLVRDAATGWLVVSPSMSPENEPEATGVKIAAGATLDNQLLFDLFSHTIAAAEILQRDPQKVSEWKKILNQLPPMQIGRYHQLQEWLQDWDNPLDHHRHVSHLYGLFPSNQISPLRNPELFSAARISMEQRGDPSTGWSMNWKINLWARLLDGDRALKLIREQISPAGGTGFSEAGGTYPNLFDAHPPFQIDGNFGFTSGVAEMLAQSHDGAVHLLPALPQAWPRGEVRGLAMRGGFVVDMRWDKGELTFLKIHSRLGGNLRLRSYSQLPPITSVKMKRARGRNPSPFFAVAEIPPPLKHTKRRLPQLSLENIYQYDIATVKDGDYIWQSADSPRQ